MTNYEESPQQRERRLRAAARVRRERELAEQEANQTRATTVAESPHVESTPPVAAPEPEIQKKIPSDGEIQQIVLAIFSENPTLVPNKRNLQLIGDWLEEQGAELNLENVRTAVQIIGYASGQPHLDKFDRQKPPAPVAPAPVIPAEPVETLAPGQLSLEADQWQLRNATPAQLRDFLKRSRPAKR